MVDSRVHDNRVLDARDACRSVPLVGVTESELAVLVVAPAPDLARPDGARVVASHGDIVGNGAEMAAVTLDQRGSSCATRRERSERQSCRREENSTVPRESGPGHGNSGGSAGSSATQRP